VKESFNPMKRATSIFLSISLAAMTALSANLNQRMTPDTVVWADKASATLRLGTGAPDEQIPVIVKFKSGAQERHHRLVAARGGSLRHELGAIRSAAYSASRATIEALAATSR